MIRGAKQQAARSLEVGVKTGFELSHTVARRDGGFVWLDVVMTVVMFLGIAYSVGEAPSAADYGHGDTVEARMIAGEPRSCTVVTR